MTTHTEQAQGSVSPQGVLLRFFHLLSAQGVDAVLSTLFFLYLAWRDAGLYGEVMYALAAGAIAMKAMQFGLYYPLVTVLGQAPSGRDAPRIINNANLIKGILFLPTMALIGGIALYRGFSSHMATILFLVALGFALEAFSGTFFADLRVRGRQDLEGRIRIASSILSYGFGFCGAALGAPPVAIACFKPISGAVQLALSTITHCRAHGGPLFLAPQWRAAARFFRTASAFALIEILGIVYNKTNIFFLENATGMQGVALYSATWNLVDPISVLASQQFLGWVIFPVLAGLWISQRDQANRLIRANALWLFSLSLAIIFVLYVESDLIIGLLYPDPFRDAIWMQRYLVWTILLSFENNLFAYVMMVAGAARTLLLFAILTTLLNLLLNVILIGPYELTGGCLVIVLTKAFMTALTFAYCQRRFGLFRLADLIFPVILATAASGLFLLLNPAIGRQPAALCALCAYTAVLWQLGKRYLGDLSGSVVALQQGDLLKSG